ncbi:MAG: OmpA family protein [Candidatus Aminicenantes bacterium]|nr:OmpA family protein [Candidatus Aminicenantes bacterium]
MKKTTLIFLILSMGIIVTLMPVHGEEDINLNHLLKGEKIISPARTFDTGKAIIKTGFTGVLNKLGAFLKENAGLLIEIGGHSDNSGTPDVNQRLSLKRAQQVKDYLVDNTGIAEDRILVKGYAAAFPIADNRTATGKAQNRRVEITTVKNTDPAGRLTYIRRDVFTKSPDTFDFIRASINQNLYHLYRVLTRKKSNANVTFQDLSKIYLVPQSLMIMYSIAEKETPSPRKQNVHLLTGGLRTKLNKLKGGLQVETPACVINSDSVGILVGIDAKKMSSLSVFDGKSEVKAQGKKVDVPEGYGTVVEMGEPPAQPEPLPEAPRLINPVKSVFNLAGTRQAKEVSVEFLWQRVEDVYHLQVAGDSQFETIIEDQKIHGNTEALSLGSGTYYWRVAAINKRGIEGYAAGSSFTISDTQDLPLEIIPGARYIIDTAQGSVTISGKTAPGTRITMNDKPVQTDVAGEFSGKVALQRGLNHIKIRGIHPDFKEKVFWVTVIRHAFCSNTLSIGLRFDYAGKNDESDHTFTLRVGKTFCLAPRLESEFSIGITRLKWKDFPGVYNNEATALPLSAELHFMLARGKITPYLSTGLSAYITFPQERALNTRETLFFISPEIGGGFEFPVFDYRARFEAVYSPFLKKEPFFTEMTHRLAFILKIMLNLTGD